MQPQPSETTLPRLYQIQQIFDAPTCSDVKARVMEALDSLDLGRQVSAGQSIAITAGSRGIANIALILQATVEHLRRLGAEPFIVPAMGSHGGGTADGQQRVLETFGITESYCGCPIRSSMETVTIATADEGFPIYFDRLAFEADHVLVCGRIKPHTNFAGDIQSGLMKMLLIGLGKKAGAVCYHQAIVEFGFPRIIRSVAPQVLRHANILAGLALVENARDRTAHVEAVRPNDFISREPELLQMAREWMPKLPFPEIDILIVDQIGKNISGTGMDTNVIGRKHLERLAGQPNIKRIIVRGLTPETIGNATGVGFADFCLRRVVDEMDRPSTVLNCLTACDLEAAKVPIYFDNDRETLHAALGSLGMTQPSDARVVWIRNTRDLEFLTCSEPLCPADRADERIRQINGPQKISWDSDGFFDQIPHESS